MIDYILLRFKEYLFNQLMIKYKSESSLTFKQIISAITPEYLKKTNLPSEDVEKIKQYARQLIMDKRSPKEIIKSLNQDTTKNYIYPRAKKDFNKITPLVEAMIHGDIDTVKDLIKNGADVNEPVEICHSKYKPIDIASNLDEYRSLFTLMLIKAGANYKNSNVLFNTITRNDIPLTELLITMYGCDVNQEKHEWGSDRVTPFTTACQQNNLDMVNKLIELGVDIEGYKGYDALNVAASNGSTKVVRMLLDKGLKANGSPNVCQDKTPLIYAANNGHTETVELLLDEGASINHLSDAKYTPIMYALKNNHIETIKKLVERGADVGYLHGFNALTLLKEHKDWTPLHYEVEKMIQSKLQQQALASSKKTR